MCERATQKRASEVSKRAKASETCFIHFIIQFANDICAACAHVQIKREQRADPKGQYTGTTQHSRQSKQHSSKRSSTEDLLHRGDEQNL
jgi:hypothetical protein